MKTKLSKEAMLILRYATSAQCEIDRRKGTFVSSRHSFETVIKELRKHKLEVDEMGHFKKIEPKGNV